MGEEVTIFIDGQKIRARKGEKLLWVALDNGIYIPHLCGVREEIHPPASCRLCFVEIEGLPEPVTSCTAPVADGMVVHTRSPRVDRLVRSAFELLLSNHDLDCRACPKNRRCKLQEVARQRKLKLRLTRLKPLLKNLPVDDSPAAFVYDPNKCVLCGRCVRLCHVRIGVGAIGFIHRGVDRRVGTFGEVPLAKSRCIQCGECVNVCPVGALAYKY
ncbi:MAG: (2Fe-2S)-binding protein [Clostridia bacterium]|nr:(2Fe-2S)-binding protein [Clostridia bacterium]